MVLTFIGIRTAMHAKGSLPPTGARTILSYLIKPLGDQIEQAFREE